MIKYLAMDVDGTMTDGKIYIGPNGEEFKAFNIRDGYGIKDICSANDIIPVIITGRTSKIVENRCRELDISEVYQGVKNKVEVLGKVARDLSAVAYIGDDLNDFQCMKAVREAGGLLGCPADATGEIKEIADFVSTKNGGEGAVREFIEHIVSCAKECHLK